MAPVPHKMDPCPFSPDKPKELVCSSGFSAAVTESGAVYTWGSGEFGRLGYYDATRRQSVPKQIKELEKQNIKKVALGSYHCMALSADKGLVYTWGRGNSGQLGHGNVGSEDGPRLVSAL